ncbi:histone-lysine N-methyltransferase NSD2-like isoform X2 [Zophobas morio]|uniref:histone-lysine N-methyltransferase NSD2-like isoform X2 n=1 Tax=Zophobas morio TaxID=2755281 RepID=UPI0030829B87
MDESAPEKEQFQLQNSIYYNSLRRKHINNASALVTCNGLQSYNNLNGTLSKTTNFSKNFHSTSIPRRVQMGQRTITEMLSYPLDKKTRCPNKFSSEIVSGTAPVLSPINATSDCGNFNGYSKKADILLNGSRVKSNLKNNTRAVSEGSYSKHKGNIYFKKASAEPVLSAIQKTFAFNTQISQDYNLYALFDIVLSRLKGYKPWPALICPEESTQLYKRLKKASSHSQKQFFFYHVCYFGPRRGTGSAEKRFFRFFITFVLCEGWVRLDRLSLFNKDSEVFEEVYHAAGGKQYVDAVHEAHFAMNLAAHERYSFLLDALYYSPKDLQTSYRAEDISASPTVSVEKMENADLVEENEDHLEKEKKKLVSNLKHQQQSRSCALCSRPGACLPCGGASTTNFICPNCLGGALLCFICKQLDDRPLYRCAVKKCIRSYHMQCLQQHVSFEYDSKTGALACPLHKCSNCSGPIKTGLLACLECTNSYHRECLPAACELYASVIRCPAHLESKKQLNIIFCMLCFEGGNLVLCDSCPAAICDHCSLKTGVPVEKDHWICHDCVSGKFVKAGDVVWARLGSHRWWPARVLAQEECLRRLNPARRRAFDLGVYFFGSRDYAWIPNNRVFPYCGVVEEAKANTKASKALFNRAVVEANAFYKEESLQRALQWELVEGSRPPPYRKIRKNVYSRNLKKMIPFLYGRCDCVLALDEHKKCLEDCVNRIMCVECSPKQCDPLICQNQRLRKRQYGDVYTFLTTNGKRWGLKCRNALAPGDLVIEYVGKLIHLDDARVLMQKMVEENKQNFYFLTLEQDIVIDALEMGNEARFINHSCDPNCQTQKWMVGGRPRVGIFAIKHISPDTEITFDYKFDTHFFQNTPDAQATVCLCGTASCRGVLGGTKSRDPPKRSIVAPPARKKAKRKTSAVKNKKNYSEDFCFICDLGGSVIMCDFPHCPKVYHLKCIEKSKAPYGTWHCPWHFCVVCGKYATNLCSTCPQSSCEAHSSDPAIRFIKEKNSAYDLLQKRLKGVQIGQCRGCASGEDEEIFSPDIDSEDKTSVVTLRVLP